MKGTLEANHFKVMFGLFLPYLKVFFVILYN